MTTLGPFPTTLRGANFTDLTGTAGISNTTTYTPFASFRVPLGQAYEFLPSTQFTPQQHYWAQAFVTAASGAPGVSGATSLALERRDATGRIIFDIMDQATAADVPSFSQSLVATQKRYFTHRTVVAQDQYLYISVESVSSQTVASFALSDVLIRCQYYTTS